MPPARGPAYGRLSAVQRLGALIAAIPAALLAIAGIVSLFAALYSSLGFDLLRKPGGLESGASAMQRASELAPWRSEGHAHLASAHLLQNDTAGAARAIGLRLQRAPADSQAWLQRATLYRRIGRLDAQLVRTYEMALARAPHSPSLHYLIALHGLYDWPFGSAELRSLWLASTEQVLRWNKRSFLLQVVHRGRDAAFCDYAGPRIARIGRWCTALDRYRAACNSAGLSVEQIDWCRNMGLAGDRKDAR